jgi:hypothetical protein
MTKRKSAQGLLLATINVAVILGVTLVIQSLAAEDPAPRSVSLNLPAESEFALPSPVEERLAFASRGSSSAAAASPSAAKGQDMSAEIVATTTIGAQESPALGTAGLDELWDLWQDESAPSPFTADSESWGPPGISVSGYSSSSNAQAFGRRSGLSTGYAGMGGGFSGSGGGSRPGNSRNSQSLASNSAGLQSSSGPTASPVGGPSLPIQAQGNPSFGGGAAAGPLFPLAQFPGVGSGVGTNPILQNGGGGTSANVTQQPVQVPEPSTALLLGCGLALATYRKRRRLNLTN